jgi:chemotaxis response regulator CheB
LSSANPLLESAAAAAFGGLVIAQDQATSEHWNMPGAAVRSGAVDHLLPLDAIGPAIGAIVYGRSISEPARSG